MSAFDHLGDEDHSEVRWMLCRADVDAVEDLIVELRSWRSLVIRGEDIMALGAVISFAESLLASEMRSCAVQVGWTLRRAEMEGTAADIAVSDDGILLDVTEFVPTGQASSCDHGSLFYTHLTHDGGFDTRTIARWIEHAAMIKGDGAKFEAEITSLPEV